MRLPRFRLRTLMILVAALALLLAVAPTAWLLFPSFRVPSWGGGKDVLLNILVVDRVTGNPIAGAEVMVNHPFRPDLIPPSRAVTGENGRVTLKAVVAASGRMVTAELEAVYRVTVWKTEHVSLSGGSVIAESEGYQSVEVPLAGDSHRSTMTISLRPLRVPSSGDPGARYVKAPDS